MKTPEEIKKGLEYCINDSYGCNEKCPYFNSLSNGVDCAVKMHADALIYIQQLETERHQLTTKCERLERERDAAVFDLGEDKLCGSCKYRDNATKCNGTNCYTCESGCPCAQIPCWYKWRGVCQENTEKPREE